MKRGKDHGNERIERMVGNVAGRRIAITFSFRLPSGRRQLLARPKLPHLESTSKRNLANRNVKKKLSDYRVKT